MNWERKRVEGRRHVELEYRSGIGALHRNVQVTRHGVRNRPPRGSRAASVRTTRDEISERNSQYPNVLYDWFRIG
ncbi:hypothetical protein EA472_20970 [Natrarchaeobius oligotrophus]|uniref:Uncharacterized protein n=1 Tax=Natrarchaeobius chitinivorans TaxID=1679083 RepID=A0A3N6M677_NATCH|nr:hypothetical protein EA472_20970 [Natrarchaeobius chitinivorans]